MIYQIWRKRPQPSMVAASYMLVSMPAMAARYTMELQPMLCHRLEPTSTPRMYLLLLRKGTVFQPSFLNRLLITPEVSPSIVAQIP